MPKELHISLEGKEHRELAEKKEKLGLTWRDVLRRGLGPEICKADEIPAVG